jgi:hypothetical protein
MKASYAPMEHPKALCSTAWNLLVVRKWEAKRVKGMSFEFGFVIQRM